MHLLPPKMKCPSLLPHYFLFAFTLLQSLALPSHQTTEITSTDFPWCLREEEKVIKLQSSEEETTSDLYTTIY
jgi:hypothetical protein